MRKILICLTTCCFLFLNPETTSAQTCRGPQRLQAKYAAANFIQISWGTGGGRESLVYRALGTTGWITVSNITSPYNLSGLKSATLYEYDITTDCATYKPDVNRIYPRFKTLDVCVNASNLSATGVTVNSAVLNWTSGSNVTGEYVTYKESTQDTYTRISAPQASPFTLTGLKPNTKYDFQIQSDCPISFQNYYPIYSTPSSFTTPKQANCSDGGLVLRTVSYNRLTAQWNNGGPNVMGYEFCYKIANSNDAPTCVSLPNTISSYEIFGNATTSYTATLKIKCTDGTVYTNEAGARIDDLPKCLVEASFSNITKNSVGIAVTGNTNTFEFVKVFYKKSSESGYTSRTFSSVSNIVLDGLMPSTDYTFYVQSSCALGAVQNNSSLNSFKTLDEPCPSPVNLRIENVVYSGTVGGFNYYNLKTRWDVNPNIINNDYKVDYILEALFGNQWINVDAYLGVPSSVQSESHLSLRGDISYRFTVKIKCNTGIINMATKVIMETLILIK